MGLKNVKSISKTAKWPSLLLLAKRICTTVWIFGKFRGFLCKNVAGEQGLALQQLSQYAPFVFEKEIQTVMILTVLCQTALKLGHFDSSVSGSFEHELN